MQITRPLFGPAASSWWGAVLREHDTEPTELAGAVMKVFLGVWLMLPLPTFAASPTYAQFRVGPEWAWGCGLLLLGLFHLFALRKGRFSWRRAGSMLGFLVWFTLAVASLWFNTASLGFPLFGVLAFWQGWAYIRIGAAPT